MSISMLLVAALPFLCAAVMAQTTPPPSATIGGSVLIPCSLPVNSLSLRWFYWQEENSHNILYHWDPSGQTQPTDAKYKNRVQVFETEFSSGNISFILDNISVVDDNKTFWAYVKYDTKSPKQWCRSTLQVSAPFQDLNLTVNNTADSSTCAARGGYPKPHVSWKGVNKSNSALLDLKADEPSLQKDPTDETFSVTSSVSVKGLLSVTCLVCNPRSGKCINRTANIDSSGKHAEKWSSGDGGADLEPLQTQTNMTPDGTYSVISTANISGLQTVTCRVYNPTLNQTLSETKPMTPPETPVTGRSHFLIGIIGIIGIICIIGIIGIICRRKGRQGCQKRPANNGAGQRTDREPRSSSMDAREDMSEGRGPVFYRHNSTADSDAAESEEKLLQIKSGNESSTSENDKVK